VPVAVQIQVLFGFQWLGIFFAWYLRWLNAFGNIGEDLARSKHTVGVQASVSVVELLSKYAVIIVLNLPVRCDAR